MAGARGIAAALKRNTTLRRLHLLRASVLPGGAEALAEALQVLSDRA